MAFEYSRKSIELQKKLTAFLEGNIFPIEQDYRRFTDNNPWVEFPRLDKLKSSARKIGLWNLFIPNSYTEFSPGLSNLDYAPLAEMMGHVQWSSQVFNCSAPDTGNMEILIKYGTQDQKSKWLKPLLEGLTRSAFLMTEPHVASSDATNISCTIEKNNDHYILNGHKWWSSGAMNPRVKFFIVMGKTNPEADKHHQQSMIIVPVDSPGVSIKRPLKVFGYNDSPEGHAEIELSNVSVPLDNILLSEGKGFEIAQGRLGPGRIHHCMRLIGTTQRALNMMCQRVQEREAFGKTLSAFSSIRHEIAQSRCDIEQARLLTLSAADTIDKKGIKNAKEIISMIKIVIPSMACKVIDRAIQIHGGLGVCQDTPLPEFWTYARAMRIADGPDEVHLNQLGRNTINKSNL